ncbi:hypothetical protein CEXT_225621 [Caerostris extrusa]|uniref:Uncharacterized protein n=1 Tax=Caerostris extrusa TaxID=172846 RepID=A0AAV4PLB7_CAEEX|nr:hypothetical protein CEXT_225621 [Caerostris extrusa]
MVQYLSATTTTTTAHFYLYSEDIRPALPRKARHALSCAKLMNRVSITVTSFHLSNSSVMSFLSRYLTTVAKKSTSRLLFCQTYKQGVHHCHIFSFEVNIGRAMTAEAKRTPGNDEADERELHLSSFVAERHSCSCIQLLLI